MTVGLPNSWRARHLWIFFSDFVECFNFCCKFCVTVFPSRAAGKNWSFDRCVQYCGSEEVNCDHALSLTYPSQKEQMIARFQKSFMCLAWGRTIWATTSVDNFSQTEQTNWNVEWDITWLYMKRENRYFKNWMNQFWNLRRCLYVDKFSLQTNQIKNCLAVFGG